VVVPFGQTKNLEEEKMLVKKLADLPITLVGPLFVAINPTGICEFFLEDPWNLNNLEGCIVSSFSPFKLNQLEGWRMVRKSNDQPVFLTNKHQSSGLYYEIIVRKPSGEPW
jgi:hypothetical protein